jgi:hypothetical protein
VVIKKNIAAIFREANLLECKSPDDYVSVDDFYKVYGYACLYASFEKVPVTSLTVTFVESRYPRELLAHFREKRNYTIEKTSPGIYIVSGDILPIQIIDSSRLSADENLWLRDLCHKLNPSEMKSLLDEIDKYGKTARIGAYLDVVARANQNSLREVNKMSNDNLTFEDFMIEFGYKAKYEERKALEIAQNMVNQGYPIETVLSLTKADAEKVKTMYQ